MNLGCRRLVWALLASALAWSGVVGVARAAITVPLAGTVAAPAATNVVSTVAPATVAAAHTLTATPPAAAAVAGTVAKTSVSPTGLESAARVVPAIARNTVAPTTATVMPATRTISHTLAPVTTPVAQKLAPVTKALGQAAAPVTRVISTVTPRAGTPGQSSSAPTTTAGSSVVRPRSMPPAGAVTPPGANTLSSTGLSAPTSLPAVPTRLITTPRAGRSSRDLFTSQVSQVPISVPRLELLPSGRPDESPADSPTRALRTPSASPGGERGPGQGIPVGAGPGGGATSAASAFFFFSFAAMLAAMLALPAPRFIGRLWLPRELGPPMPFVVLLDHPG